MIKSALALTLLTAVVASAATPPDSTLPQRVEISTQPPANGLNDLLKAIDPSLRPGVKTALDRAATHRSEWEAALQSVPPDQLQALAYLLGLMPTSDLQTLKKEFLLENIDLAYKARAAAPWGKEIPEEIFRSALLPYANVNEARDPWRKEFAEKFAPLVAQCHSAGDAALILNKEIFPTLNVIYHPTKRPKPDQSPKESIAAGYASCTGLSILLIDACRSVGVPARIVGTPLWTVPKGDANGNHAGNHMWVEIWDGQWHVLGASEVSKLDDTWFLDNASRAIQGMDDKIEGIYLHRIYASTMDPTAPFWFPLVWDLNNKEVQAQDVTLAYANRTPVKLTVDDTDDKPAKGHLELRQAGRLIASLKINGSTNLILSANQNYDAVFTTAKKKLQQSISIPNEKSPEVVLTVR